MAEDLSLYCKFCSRLCKNKNSLAQHELRCRKNANRRCYDNLKSLGREPWNKGLTLETDERIRLATEKCKKTNSEKPEGSFSHPHTEEFKQKQRERALENHWENHFGSHRSYLYKGIKFVSSYEVILAKDLDSNGVLWEKPRRFKYTDNKGKEHYYTADFYLPEYNIYLDPKNDYLIEHANPVLGYTDIQKIGWVQQQNNIKVIILDKNHLSWECIKEFI